MFDSALAIILMLETWVFPFVLTGTFSGSLSALRLIRLSRITRIAKVLTRIPEFVYILKGLTGAFSAVSYTGLLMFLFLFCFALLFTASFHGGYEEIEWFSE